LPALAKTMAISSNSFLVIPIPPLSRKNYG
jgi:hypothetical protein